VSSSSSAGGTPPYLAPYFAAKAGMDALAVIYARELTLWGIETSIVVPGAFTGGTNHFAHSGRPIERREPGTYMYDALAFRDQWRRPAAPDRGLVTALLTLQRHDVRDVGRRPADVQLVGPGGDVPVAGSRVPVGETRARRA